MISVFILNVLRSRLTAQASTAFGYGLALVVMGAPTVAQNLAFSPAATEVCLGSATSEVESIGCIGASAETCFSAQGNYTNYAIGACFGAEADYWDHRLNAAYRELMRIEKDLVAENKRQQDQVTDSAAALREMQRAWILYRDAACFYEYATFEGASGGGPASAQCLMQITGRQALTLEARLRNRIQ